MASDDGTCQQGDTCAPGMVLQVFVVNSSTYLVAASIVSRSYLP
jgi:hypothetical protein